MKGKNTNIKYRTQKNIPCNALYKLFLAVGWANEATTTQEQLVGCVRVLSDLYFRPIIYDLAVLPEYQNKGIGKELVRRCINVCEDSEWLVQTDCAKGFLKKSVLKKTGRIS